MRKFTLLLFVLTSACALDTDTSSISSLGSCDSECNPPPPPPPGTICPIDDEEIDLDLLPANVDDNDKKVSFCHATSSATNPFVVITTAVAACKAHEEHEHLEKGGHHDIFGSDGCED